MKVVRRTAIYGLIVLLACATTVIVRSFFVVDVWVGDKPSGNSTGEIYMLRGRVVYQSFTYPGEAGFSSWSHASYAMESDIARGLRNYLKDTRGGPWWTWFGVHYLSRTELGGTFVAYGIPMWPLFLVPSATLLIVPLWKSHKAIRTRGRACPNCGYDMRSNIAVCSECGYRLTREETPTAANDLDGR